MLPCRILRLSASIKVRGTQTHVRQLSDCGEGDFESSNKKAVRELELQRARRMGMPTTRHPYLAPAQYEHVLKSCQV